MAFLNCNEIDFAHVYRVVLATTTKEQSLEIKLTIGKAHIRDIKDQDSNLLHLYFCINKTGERFHKCL